MTRFLARELAAAHWFDISAARRDLGYQPEVTIEEGMQRLRAWLKRPQESQARAAAWEREMLS